MLPLANEAPAWFGYLPAEPLPPPLLVDPALPLVSIVTPSYNQGHFLEATITSVLSQAYPNLEYWVIDGGSDDESLSILRRYETDPRLHWLSEPDQGQSDAINKGWARCRGSVLAWLNSDDTYLPDAIRRQVDGLQADPAAGAVYADALYTNADGHPLHVLHSRPYSPLAVLRLELPIQPTVFLRRDLVAALGPLRLDRRYSMDSDYWAKAARVRRFRRVDGIVATYRLHPHSKSVTGFAGFYREWLAIAEAFFADPQIDPGLRRARGGVVADIYAAMANLEARQGDVPAALRYLGFALTAAGFRPRMLKLPISLFDRVSGWDLSAHITELWGRMQRGE
jgi:glycosyltransferase involved in cell wall biosynthesis